LKTLIEAAALNNEPTVMAFDIPPSPANSADSDSAFWEEAWREWLTEQYGDVQRAQQVIPIMVSKNEAKDSASSASAAKGETHLDSGFTRDVYERCLRDVYSRSFGYIVRCLRSWGARQLITAHMPVANAADRAALSLQCPNALWGCAHLDFLSLGTAPRAEARQQLLEGAFWTAYARGSGGAKPVLWSDFSAVAPDSHPTRSDLEAQAKMFKNMFDMVFRSRAGGLFGGRFAGGISWESRRDSGLTEPDGTWRPVAAAYREAANQVRRERTAAGPSAGGRVFYLDADATQHPETYLKQLGEDLAAGTVAELRPAAFGKRTADWRVETFGAAEFRAPAPMRSLNAEWGFLDVAGSEVLRRPGEAIRMKKGERLQAQVINTGPVSWDASREGQAKSVWIRFSREGRMPVLLSLPPTAFGRSATIAWVAGDPGEWTARPWLADVGEFGEALHIHVTD
jgi:hypothetical protein